MILLKLLFLLFIPSLTFADIQENGNIIQNSVIKAHDLNFNFQLINTALQNKALPEKTFLLFSKGDEVSKIKILSNFNLITEIDIPIILGNEISSTELNSIFYNVIQSILSLETIDPNETASIPFIESFENTSTSTSNLNFTSGFIADFIEPINADGYKVYRTPDCSGVSISDISPVPNYSYINFPSSFSGNVNRETELFSVQAYKEGLQSKCYGNYTITFDNVPPNLTANFPLNADDEIFFVNGTCDYDDYKTMIETKNNNMFSIRAESTNNFPVSGYSWQKIIDLNDSDELVVKTQSYPYIQGQQTTITEEPLSNYFTIDDELKTCNYSFDLKILRENNSFDGEFIETFVKVEQKGLALLSTSFISEGISFGNSVNYPLVQNILYSYSSPYQSTFENFNWTYPHEGFELINFYSQFKLYEGSNNIGSAQGEIHLSSNVDKSFPFTGYLTVATENNEPIGNLYGIVIFKLSENLLASIGQNYRFRILGLIPFFSYSGNLYNDPNYKHPFMLNAIGSSGGVSSLDSPDSYQIIASYNHMIKLLKGIIPENTPYPTGITSLLELDTYLENDTNSQLIKNIRYNILEGTYPHDGIFYSIKSN